VLVWLSREMSQRALGCMGQHPAAGEVQVGRRRVPHARGVQKLPAVFDTAVAVVAEKGAAEAAVVAERRVVAASVGERGAARRPSARERSGGGLQRERGAVT
jgi:hypothetical protein